MNDEQYVWATRRYDLGIDRVRVSRVSDSSVWVKVDGRRHPRTSDWVQYHDSYRAARAFLVQLHSGKVERAENALSTARRDLDKVQALPMVEP